MKKTSRWLLRILILALALALLPTVALAYEVEGEWQYEVTDGQATITKYTGSATMVNVPDTIGGYPVVTFGGGGRVFSYGNPTAVVLPEGVKTISEAAFYAEDELVSVTIPESVVSIDGLAFNHCSSLPDLTVSASNPVFKAENGMLLSKDGKTLLWLTMMKSGSFAVPEGVTAIGDYALANCFQINELTLPAGLQSIGAHAFEGMNRVHSLDIPASVTSIGDQAFSGMDELVSVTVGAGNTAYKAVDDVLFTTDGATLLLCAARKTGDYAIPAGVTTIAACAFEENHLSSVSFPAGVTTIGKYAFCASRELTELVLPEGLTTIGDYAFCSCSDLERVVVQAGVTALSSYCFEGCGKLVSVSLPAGLTTIGESAFSQCNALEAIVLPDSVTLIDSNVFYRDGVLKSVLIPAATEQIRWNAFDASCASLTDVYYTGTAEQWAALTGTPNGNDALNTATIHLVTPGATTVIRQPVAFVGAEGDTGVFSVLAYGSGLSYQWQTKQAGKTEFSDVAAASGKTATYSLVMKSRHKNMEVRCKITDSAENVVYSDVVTVSMVSLDDALNDVGGKLAFVNAELNEASDPMIYPWAPAEYDGYLCGVSTNGGVDRSNAEFGLTVNLDRSATLSFWYQVWGEGNNSSNWYDYGALYVDGATDAYARLKRTHDTEWTFFELALTPGEHTLLWRYRKDSSTSNSGDLFAVRSVRLDPAWIVFSSQPEDASAGLNEPYSFSVEALGDGLTYQWQVSTDGGENWQNATETGNQTASLSGTVASLDFFDRQYRCQLTDGAGHVAYSTEATLYETALRIVHQPNWPYLVVGETAKITVEAEGSCLTYRWLYSADNGNSWQNAAWSGNQTATLSVPVTEDVIDSRMAFYCVITDRLGETVTTNSVCIDEDAVEVTQDLPAALTCTVGQPFSLTAGMRGSNTVYQWQKWDGESWIAAGLTGSDTATVSGTYAANLAGTTLRCLGTDRQGRTAVTSSTILASVGSLDEALSAPGAILHFTTDALNEGSSPKRYPWIACAAGAESFAMAGNTGVDGSESHLYLTCTLTKDTNLSFDVKVRGEGTSYDYGRFDVDGVKVFLYGANPDEWVHIVTPLTAGEHTFEWYYRKDGSTSKPGDCFLLKNLDFGENAVEPQLAITSQPANCTVAAGATADFTVAAIGAGVLSYQWKYRASPEGAWTDVSAASGKTAAYSLTVRAKHNGYQYKCVVTDGASTVESGIATLTVTAPSLTITAQPENRTAAAGSTATFTVAAANGAGELSYQWKYRTSPEGAWTDVSAASGKTAAYSLTVRAKHNGYQYKCVVTDGVSTVESGIATLTVTAPSLTITAQPENQTVAAGATATFTVAAANGAGELSYQWKYRTSPEGAWTDVSAASGKTAAYSLTVKAKHNGYQYKCVVTDGVITVESGIATLTVGAASLTITTQPENQTVAAGSTATFTVTAANGAGELSYQWKYRTSPEGAWTDVSAASGKTAAYSLTVKAKHNGYQ